MTDERALIRSVAAKTTAQLREEFQESPHLVAGLTHDEASLMFCTEEPTMTRQVEGMIAPKNGRRNGNGKVKGTQAKGLAKTRVLTDKE